MSKKNKIKKLDKETKQAIETVSELFKSKDGDYVIRKKKSKKVKKILKHMCFHWLIRKNECQELVKTDAEDPKYWRCRCGARFMKRPPSEEEREGIIDRMMELINFYQFYSVRMGGDKDDAAIFLKLKKIVPEFRKMVAALHKAIIKKAEYEENKVNSDENSQFSQYYSDYSYRF